MEAVHGVDDAGRPFMHMGKREGDNFVRVSANFSIDYSPFEKLTAENRLYFFEMKSSAGKTYGAYNDAEMKEIFHAWLNAREWYIEQGIEL